MKCHGQLCPESLAVINTPRYVIRAGIIPYQESGGGRILLGIKDRQYTDFGGGCKIGKMELPFDCAAREFAEETLGILNIDLANITHVFVSGKKHPHQVILLVRVDRLDYSLERRYATGTVGPKELSSVQVLSFNEFRRMSFRDMAPSLRSIYDMLRTVI